MSDELIKVNDDLWCLWSHIADGPKVWGTREEVQEWMTVHERQEVEVRVAERFERAERTGSSNRGDRGTGLIYDQQGFLLWKDLEPFLASYIEEGEQFDTSLLQPFDD